MTTLIIVVVGPEVLPSGVVQRVMCEGRFVDIERLIFEGRNQML